MRLLLHRISLTTIIVIWCLSAFSQAQGTNAAKGVSYGTGSATTSCNTGDLYVQTDATAGSNVWTCTGSSPSTWVQQSGGTSTTFAYVTTSNFTTASATATAITGLTYQLAANTAQNVAMECHLSVKASGATTVNFYVQDDTLAPTNMEVTFAAWNVFPAGVTVTTTVAATSGNISGVATDHGMASIYAYVEQPSGAASNLKVLVSLTGGATFTAYRDSYCTFRKAA